MKLSYLIITHKYILKYVVQNRETTLVISITYHYNQNPFILFKFNILTNTFFFFSTSSIKHINMFAADDYNWCYFHIFFNLF